MGNFLSDHSMGDLLRLPLSIINLWAERRNLAHEFLCREFLTAQIHFSSPVVDLNKENESALDIADSCPRQSAS